MNTPHTPANHCQNLFSYFLHQSGPRLCTPYKGIHFLVLTIPTLFELALPLLATGYAPVWDTLFLLPPNLLSLTPLWIKQLSSILYTSSLHMLHVTDYIQLTIMTNDFQNVWWKERLTRLDPTCLNADLVIAPRSWRYCVLISLASLGRSSHSWSSVEHLEWDLGRAPGSRRQWNQRRRLQHLSSLEYPWVLGICDSVSTTLY